MPNIAWSVGDLMPEHDAGREAFRNAPEANQYLKRTYRAPWMLPEEL